jgi:hypothetical protein
MQKGLSSLLPEEFELAQNYPSLFNPETIIQLFVPQPTHIKVEIVNISGQKVVTLVDDHRESENYQVRWVSATSRESCGEWRLLLSSAPGGHTIVKKMLLIE